MWFVVGDMRCLGQSRRAITVTTRGGATTNRSMTGWWRKIGAVTTCWVWAGEDQINAKSALERSIRQEISLSVRIWNAQYVNHYYAPLFTCTWAHTADTKKINRKCGGFCGRVFESPGLCRSALTLKIPSHLVDVVTTHAGDDNNQ